MAEPTFQTNQLFQAGVSGEDAAAQLAGQTSEELETGDEAVELDDNLEDQQLDVEDDEDLESEDEEEIEGEEDSEESEDSDVEGFEIEGDFFSVDELKELRESKMMRQDYTQKTQEVAKQRQEVSTRLQETIDLNNQYVESIQQAQQFIAANIMMDGQSDDDLARLRNEDFDEYLRVKDQRDQRGAYIQQLMAQEQAVKAEAAKAQQEVLQQRQVQAAQEISDKIPGYSDSSQKIGESVGNLLTSEFGFTGQELDQIDDSRMFLVAHALWEARKGDSPEARKSIAKKKAKKSVSPVLKSGSPKTQTQRQVAKSKKVVSQAINSGSEQDAVAALLQLRSK